MVARLANFGEVNPEPGGGERKKGGGPLGSENELFLGVLGCR